MTGAIENELQLSKEEFENLVEVSRTLALWDQEAKDAQGEALEPQSAGAARDKRVNRFDGLEGSG